MIKTLSNAAFIVGEISFLIKDSVIGSFTRPFYFSRIVDQIRALGSESVIITTVIGMTTGFIMTLQFGHGLAKFGGTLYVPALVSLSIFREMAPMFLSLVIAGRVGSGIAAEIGAMNVTQQIDALRAMGTSPVRVLVVPRMLALMIALPLLATYADFVGLIGSFFVSYMEFDMSLGFFMNKVLTTLKMHDYISGLVKTIIFAFIITIVACHRGLKTKCGTKGVGDAATWVVVTSSVWILISDFILTKIFLTFWIGK